MSARGDRLIRLAKAQMTKVCDKCGAVYWATEGHVCIVPDKGGRHRRGR